MRTLVLATWLLKAATSTVYGQSLEPAILSHSTHFYTDALALDFYSSTEWTANDPVVVFLHGGGFSRGTRDAEPVVHWAEAVSKNNIAVASISYRLLQAGVGFGCDVPLKEKRAAIRAAAEDAERAGAWLLANGMATGALFVGGSSAGAEAALWTAYGTARTDVLWDGVLSFSGALEMEGLSGGITVENAPPLFAYHGRLDAVVPCEQSAHRGCSEDDPGWMELNGALALGTKLRDMNRQAEVHVVETAGHEMCNAALVHPMAIKHAVRFLGGEVEDGDFHQPRLMDGRGFIVDEGDPVSDWALTALDGTAYTRENTAGQVVVLQFTASWCSVCRKEMPHLEAEVWKRFGSTGDFLLLGVDYDEQALKIERFAEQTGITYPIAPDPEGAVFHLFAGPNQGVTRNVVIDRDGNIVMLTRLFEEEEFEKMVTTIGSLLGE